MAVAPDRWPFAPRATAPPLSMEYIMTGLRPVATASRRISMDLNSIDCIGAHSIQLASLQGGAVDGKLSR